MIDPLAAIGLVAIGALAMLVAVVVLACVAVWYVASGLRIRVEGLRFVDRDPVLESLRRPFDSEPPPRAEDFYDQSRPERKP